MNDNKLRVQVSQLNHAVTEVATDVNRIEEELIEVKRCIRESSAFGTFTPEGDFLLNLHNRLDNVHVLVREILKKI